jgi:NAD(P)H-dependent FMN reductase
VAPKLNIIIGSTRPGRIGPSVATWFHGFAAEHGAFEPVLVDLAGFALPVFDEPKHPRMQQYEHEHTKRWSASVKSGDAFVFVTPEYNYGTSPALLNALTYLAAEWNYAPAGIVSYGGVSGGLRAAEFLKPTLSVLKMMPIPEGVAVPAVGQQIGPDKTFAANDLNVTAARTMLGELALWTEALKGLRAKVK